MSAAKGGQPQLPQQPQGRIVCQGCYIMLMYPQGASNVRCSQCGTITAVDNNQPNMLQQGMTRMAQLVCVNCRILLMYPRTANSVQCAMCGHVNPANGVGHIKCSGCRHMLMYELGAQSVKCALCQAITPVPAQRLGEQNSNGQDEEQINNIAPEGGGNQFNQLSAHNNNNNASTQEDNRNDVSNMVGMNSTNDE